MKEKVFEALKLLAAKLGTTADFLWDVLIRQAYIEGITSIIIASVPFILLIFYMIFVKWFFKNVERLEDDHENIWCACWITSVVLGAALMVTIALSICQIKHIVTVFLNPEYWALEQILNIIK